MTFEKDYLYEMIINMIGYHRPTFKVCKCNSIMQHYYISHKKDVLNRLNKDSRRDRPTFHNWVAILFWETFV